MFNISLARRTVDSKIDENRKQNYELIQVVGILYRYCPANLE